MDERPGRNSPCPCGSGNKYKNCCAEKGTIDRALGPQGMPMIAAAAVVAAGAIAAYISFANPTPSGAARPSAPEAARSAGAATQPAAPGQAPISPIQVSGAVPITGAPPVMQTKGGATPPPGPTPAGKQWSPEHGHWHDAPRTIYGSDLPGKVASTQMQVPQPAGPAPVGKVWSTQHGHFHDAPGRSTAPGAAPANLPPPTGRVWSKEHNHWHNVPAN